MVSTLHKELERNVEKLSVMKLEVMQWRSKNKVNEPYWINPPEVLQSWLINTGYHLRTSGKGRWGLKPSGVNYFLPLKRGRSRERVLIDDLRQVNYYRLPLLRTLFRRKYIPPCWGWWAVTLKLLFYFAPQKCFWKDFCCARAVYPSSKPAYFYQTFCWKSQDIEDFQDW